MVRRPHPDPMTESFFQLQDEDYRRLGITRAQKQFDNDEDEKMKGWLREYADILINVGEPAESPERYT